MSCLRVWAQERVYRVRIRVAAELTAEAAWFAPARTRSWYGPQPWIDRIRIDQVRELTAEPEQDGPIRTVALSGGCPGKSHARVTWYGLADQDPAYCAAVA